MISNAQMTGTILAGGENRRIPMLKSHIEIDGIRIIDSGVKTLKSFLDKVVISTNNPELYFYCGAPMIGDVINERGPATGIFSTLLSTEDDIFVIACDMPFIKKELIRLVYNEYLKENYGFRKYDAVIPIFDGKPQPLLSIYTKNIISTIEGKIKKGLKGMRDLLTDLNVLFIKEAMVREADPEGRSFVNINTIEDYKKVISNSSKCQKNLSAGTNN